MVTCPVNIESVYIVWQKPEPLVKGKMLLGSGPFVFSFLTILCGGSQLGGSGFGDSFPIDRDFVPRAGR